MSRVKILNSDDVPAGGTKMSALEVSQNLQKAMLRMTGKFLNETTGLVDYEQLKDSSEYKEYRALACRLKDVDPGSLKGREHMAFFINLYNALTMDSIAQLDTMPASTLEVCDFWSCHAYILGPYHYTLDHIEHGVLRGNRAHPSTNTPVLGPGDPRLAFTCAKPDPRIHFALNCGAKSCPRVRVYTEVNLESGLEAASYSYLRQEVKVEDGRLKVPQILEWYLQDFASDMTGMLRWIQKYVGEAERRAIDNMLTAGGDSGGDSGDKETTEMPMDFFYDWSLNAV